jgi:hypothetical protein
MLKLLVSKGLAPIGFDRLDHSEIRFASEKKAPPEEKIPRHGIQRDQFTLTMWARE